MQKVHSGIGKKKQQNIVLQFYEFKNVSKGTLLIICAKTLVPEKPWP